MSTSSGSESAGAYDADADGRHARMRRRRGIRTLVPSKRVAANGAAGTYWGAEGPLTASCPKSASLMVKPQGRVTRA